VKGKVVMREFIRYNGQNRGIPAGMSANTYLTAVMANDYPDLRNATLQASTGADGNVYYDVVRSAGDKGC